MIDPDGIRVQQHNSNTVLNFGEIPPFDYTIYDLEDEKELKKYFSDIEREIRGSFEYRGMIKYMKDNMNMDQCAFIQVSSKDNYNIRIEVHHYPFTLYDIVTIVYKKRCYYHQPLNLQLLAKECTMLHYKLLVGLIPLSKTAHQLVHAGKLFIPVDNVIGRYKLFVEFYKPFCDEEQLDSLNRIEKYSMEETTELLSSSTVLEQNEITIENKSTQYQLPDMNNISTAMSNRISTIKNNGYILPTVSSTDISSNNTDTNIVSTNESTISTSTVSSLDSDEPAKKRKGDLQNRSTSPVFYTSRSE